jgi:hypothetical protein
MQCADRRAHAPTRSTSDKVASVDKVSTGLKCRVRGAQAALHSLTSAASALSTGYSTDRYSLGLWVKSHGQATSRSVSDSTMQLTN